MCTAEWDVAFRLVTAAGTLPINATSGYRYVLNHEACSAAPEPRTSVDPLPRKDGATIHHAFKTGYRMTLAMELWYDDKPAMLAVRRTMLDAIDPHLAALLNADILTDAGGRVFWQPSGYGDERMLDGCRLLEWPTVIDDGFVTTVTLPLHTRFPYGIDATEIQTAFSGTETFTITNAGNVEQWPVIQVYGPTDAFTLDNLTTGYSLYYDSFLPGALAIGGGDYAEIDMFRFTAYLNGNSANLKPGIELTNTDFWALVPGPNDIQCVGVGAGTIVKSNNCWC